MQRIHNLFLSATALAVSAIAMAADRPNFVFVLVDDLGWKDLGCYGSESYESPRIDAFAKDAILFTDNYSAHPVCSPTRAAIMTGKHPNRVQITDWIPGHVQDNAKLITPMDRDNLALEETTIAEALKAEGYQTFFAGKWHLGDKGHLPTDQGFEINKGGHHKGSPPGGYYAPFENPELEDKPDDHYLTDRLTDESIAFLHERDAQRPFLLFLAYYTVHAPIQGCDAYDDLFAERFADIKDQPPIPEGEATTRQTQSDPKYAGMVKSLDHNFGRLVDALDEMDLDDNTVVIFTSDNGGLTTLGRRLAPTAVLPLRAGKGWCYEGGIRVPLIMRAPGITRAGLTVSEPTVSMDFFPTILELAKIKADAKLDGRSLVPVLTGGSLDRDEIYWHFPHYHGSEWKPGAAIRQGDWKLIRHFEKGPDELYNLAEDIGERNDLSKRNPEKVAALADELEHWQTDTDAMLPIPNPDYDPAL